MDTEQEAQALRALWKSGRDKIRSFFVRFSDLKREVGDDKIADWCVRELHLTVETITRFARILNESEAEVIKAEMAAANKAAAAKRAEEAQKREVEKAEQAAKVAAAKAEEEKQKAEANKRRDTEKRRQERQKDPDAHGSRANAQSRRRTITNKVSDADLADMVKMFKQAEEMCEKGVQYWIEGTMAKVKVLSAARSKFKADQDFGTWFDGSGIVLSRDDRQALVGLGRFDEKRLREILTSTDRRSYRLIWLEHKPTLTVVAG